MRLLAKKQRREADLGLHWGLSFSRNGSCLICSWEKRHKAT